MLEDVFHLDDDDLHLGLIRFGAPKDEDKNKNHDWANSLIEYEDSMLIGRVRDRSTQQSMISPRTSMISDISKQTFYFNVPRNENLMAFWDIVADRLYKIRNSLNIEGIKRTLALFAPPIDPGMLVKARAAGLSISEILADAGAALPHYRFKVIVAKALEIARSSPDYFVPQQFQNPANPQMHYKTTAVELTEQLGKKIDVYVSGIGSGGTLQGVAQYLLEQNPDCKIVAVEPRNVSALLGDEPGLHQIQGIGDGFIPDILDTSIITDISEVSDEDAICTARELARVQGLLVGMSSGANVWAAKRMAEKYGTEKNIATVLPDRAERYFSTALI